jgi:hypothetical protein
MIAIINMGYTYTGQKEDECLYWVQINHDFICEFKHVRADGLAKCLERAAKAVKLYEKQEKK